MQGCVAATTALYLALLRSHPPHPPTFSLESPIQIFCQPPTLSRPSGRNGRFSCNNESVMISGHSLAAGLGAVSGKAVAPPVALEAVPSEFVPKLRVNHDAASLQKAASAASIRGGGAGGAAPQKRLAIRYAGEQSYHFRSQAPTCEPLFCFPILFNESSVVQMRIFTNSLVHAHGSSNLAGVVK